MGIFEIILNGLESIWSNKLRTTLSILGIIIGVSSVIILNGLGAGSQQSIVENLESMGVNLITISKGGGGNVYAKSSTNSDFDYDVVEYLRDNIDGLKGVTGVVNGSSQIIYGANNMSSRIYGIDTQYFTVNNLEVMYGNTITKADNDEMRKVAVIGYEIFTDIFDPQDPIGKKIKVGNSTYEVIGILKETGGQGDSALYIPLKTAQIRFLGDKSLGTIYVAAASSDQVNKIQGNIENALLVYFNEKSLDDASFSVNNRADMLERVSSMTGTITMFLSGIAAISLIVGGIGIMNIMLVSVTERTKEIGIRKAIGAKKSDILLQFLVEATLLSLFGGIIGMIISFLVILLLSNYGFTAVIEYQSVIISVGFSLFIGIFFGFVPAYKAAGLRPIQALRFE